MKFGKRYEDAPAPGSTSGGGAGGKWIKGFKEGETRLRFLQEMKDWVVYYEHYNPAGTYFPCTGDRKTCPGCTSTNERMKSASRKTAVNALVGQYVDVYKLPVKLVNRLDIRAQRNDGTITDRDYVITRIGMDQSTEYDLESGNAAPLDLSAYELINIEDLLAQQFAENFPDFNADDNQDPAPVEEIKKVPNAGLISSQGGSTEAPKSPPSEPVAQNNGGAQETEVELTLDDLKTMTPDQLKTLCGENGKPVPQDKSTQHEIIEWMMDQFA